MIAGDPIKSGCAGSGISIVGAAIEQASNPEKTFIFEFFENPKKLLIWSFHFLISYISSEYFHRISLF